MNAVLARPWRIDLESFSRAVGLHPEVVVHLVHLGVLDAETGPQGELLFASREIARGARIQRLRMALSLNYASLGLVLDLLDRIDVLESALRSRSLSTGGTQRTWT